MNNVIAIVVTYNRKALLQECLEALKSQSLMPSRILIIDNNSTDGTAEWLQSSNYLSNSTFIYQRLNENIGGAGGFNKGLAYALANNYDWAWIMDDDAIPEHNAFENLMRQASDYGNIYGSIATNGHHTSWDITLISDSGSKTIDKLKDIPDIGEVSFLPFLGLLISNIMLKTIGLPDSDFFIAGDDLEYCYRAKLTQAKILVVGKSKIQHPKANIKKIKFLGITIKHLKVPPWKNYYNVRNKILISKQYHPETLWSKTIPGIVFRMIVSLTCDQQKIMHIYSSLAGIIDGVFNIKGKRHRLWKISQ